jgi:diguanylate cyclase (GGDEF)-like protein
MLSNLVADNSWETMRKTCDRILSHGGAEAEIELLDKNGNCIPFYLTGTLIEHTEQGRSIAGIGIDIRYRKQLEQELVKRASTDVLTGTFNRLKMEETLEHEISRCGRYQSALSIAMLDIDYFKKVNDTYGHATGDEVLKAVAMITQQQLRDVDFLARWGGEEFMIISAETTLDQIHYLAERVRQAIAEQPCAKGIRVTASFGIGQYEPGESQKELLKRVDDALYLAKKRGRNQVRLAQPPKPPLHENHAD